MRAHGNRDPRASRAFSFRNREDTSLSWEGFNLSSVSLSDVCLMDSCFVYDFNTSMFLSFKATAMCMPNILTLIVFSSVFCAEATPRATDAGVQWRIVSIGKAELPSDWEDNRLVLKQGGKVAGPMVDSEEFHGFRRDKVSTEDYESYKVTTKVSGHTSDIKYRTENDKVIITFDYSWIHEESSGRGTFAFKCGCRTVLTLPATVLDGNVDHVVGQIQQTQIFHLPDPSGRTRLHETNVTSILESRLKNEQIEPTAFESAQRIKTLPVKLERILHTSEK